MNVAVIGAGSLGRELVAAVYDDHEVTATRRTRSALAELQERFPDLSITTDNAAAATWADVILLSVKPDAVDTVLGPIDTNGTVLISAVAGVTIEQLADNTGGAVARIMTGVFVPEELVFYTVERDRDAAVVEQIFPETRQIDEDALPGRAFIGCDTGLIARSIEEKITELAEHGVPSDRAREAYGRTLQALGGAMVDGASGVSVFERVTGGSEDSYTYRLYELLRDRGCVEAWRDAVCSTVQ